MVTLRRTVRFAINLDAAGRPVDDPPSYNAYAARPSPLGLSRFFELDVTCRGPADPTTGYLINIKDIDQAVRSVVIPPIAAACAAGADADPFTLLPALTARINAALPVECSSLVLHISPYHAVEMQAAAPAIALLRASFDLSASHRLNCPSLSPEQNREIFGKCNNASGHGHNYRVEPCVALSLAALPAHPFPLQTLERITDQTLIQPFDHRHLNLDTPQFADSTGLNPTVENIARVFFELLAPRIAAASKAATLRSLTVWETDRTCATFPADVLVPASRPAQ